LKKIEGTYTVNEFKIPVEVKMGISIFPKDGKFPEDLYKNAEIALLKAKETPGRKFEFFSKTSYSEISRIIILKRKIREVIQKNSIKMYYQPIVELKNQKIFGFESLFRLITISINISPLQLNKPDFDKEIIKKLQEKDIQPDKIIIEITEGALMENISDSIKKLKRLKSYGIQIGIDDFGTGYSSLNYLKNLPADYLKIDISFVSGIGKNRSDEMIIKTIISMAKNLEMKTIAEGIENEDQARFLTEEGCDFGQGYYFGKPSPQNEINRFLQKSL